MSGRAFARSKSQLSQYERCPAAYRFSYIERIKFSNFWLVKGIACHEGVAAYFRDKAEGRPPSADAALDVFREKVAESFTRLSEAEGRSPVMFEGQTREKLEAEGLAQLRAYLTQLAPTIEPLMVEEWAELTLPSGVLVRGKLDLVDTNLVIRDAKFLTDAMKPDEVHYEADAPLYSAMFRAKTGRWPAGFTFDVVALGRKKVPEPVATSLEYPEFERLMPALVEARLADLDAVDQAITAGIFHRRPSVQNCNKCTYANLCWHGMKAGIATHTQAEQPSLEPVLRQSLSLVGKTH